MLACVVKCDHLSAATTINDTAEGLTMAHKVPLTQQINGHCIKLFCGRKTTDPIIPSRCLRVGDLRVGGLRIWHPLITISLLVCDPQRA